MVCRYLKKWQGLIILMTAVIPYMPLFLIMTTMATLICICSLPNWLSGMLRNFSIKIIPIPVKRILINFFATTGMIHCNILYLPMCPGRRVFLSMGMAWALPLLILIKMAGKIFMSPMIFLGVIYCTLIIIMGHLPTKSTNILSTLRKMQWAMMLLILIMMAWRILLRLT